MENDIVQTFCDLVKIPSPSGKELEVAKHIQGYLKKIGIESHFDDAGEKVGCNCGNLIAKIGSGKPTIMFVAHMDTVEDGVKPISPQIRDGVIYSDGTTILGSDDKAGVAALMEAMKELKNGKDLPAVIGVFAVNEEKGTMGVKYLKIDESVDFAFDVDGSDRPGKFINKSLGRMEFEIQIYGKEAHAASAPEKGASAIRAAGLLISKLEIGKDSRGRTLNIGKMSGGRVMNVVPGYAKLEGEARAYSADELSKKLEDVDAACKEACDSVGCTYKFEIKEEGRDPVFETDMNSSIVALARKATETAGIEFSLKTASACLQANLLAGNGFKVLALCKGGRDAHSVSECVNIKDLEDTKRIIVEIVKQAGKMHS